MKPGQVALLAAIGLLAGCQSTHVAPAGSQGAKLEADESRLLIRVNEEQGMLDGSGFVVHWPEVDAYLNGLVTRLHPGPLVDGAHLRVQVLVDPTVNAFALPNGMIYIHTGMLARLENEAQLATILGHELTHATNRHGLQNYRNVKNQSAFLATITVGTGGIGGLLGGLGAMASVSGYSQDLEREADQAGFRLVCAAGYDPRESPKVFRILLEESKRSKLKEPFFFASHPRLQERIASFDQLITALPPAQRTGRIDRAEYEAILPPVLLANAQAAQRAGDFDFAQTCAEHCLRLQPDNPAAAFQLAEVHRKRGKGDDQTTALRLFRELVARHPDFAEGHRGLGLSLLKSGDKPAAAQAFHRYLNLRPAAPDRAYIESFLQQCENKSSS